MDCPFRGGNPLIKILKCTGEGAEFKPIDLEDVFDELSSSVEGSCEMYENYDFLTVDKKDIVKKYETLKIIQ